MQGRRDHFLRPGRVHVFLDDGGHLLVHPPAQRQEEVATGHGFANESAANQQLVAFDGRAALVAAGRFSEKGGIFHKCSCLMMLPTEVRSCAHSM